MLSVNFFLDGFDPSKQEHHNILEKSSKNIHTFIWFSLIFLKVLNIILLKVDQMLSHTAIATYDRHLLYEFLETPEINTSKTAKKQPQSKK